VHTHIRLFGAWYGHNPGLELQIMNKTLCSIVAGVALALSACEKSRIESSAEVKTPYRTDFAPEEFGIGKLHTQSDDCNREIDELLEQIRTCYNGGSDTDCATLQRTHSAQIGKLKNSHKCRQ
jgi:hypothetical protein